MTLAGFAATIVSQNDTQIVVTAASGTAGPGHVVVTADTGARVREEGAFTYLNAAVVHAIYPRSGQLDTKVTIYGERMLNGGTAISSVTLVGVSADLVSGNDTVIVATANDISPGSEGKGDVVIVSNSDAVLTAKTNGTKPALSLAGAGR